MDSQEQRLPEQPSKADLATALSALMGRTPWPPIASPGREPAFFVMQDGAGQVLGYTPRAEELSRSLGLRSLAKVLLPESDAGALYEEALEHRAGELGVDKAGYRAWLDARLDTDGPDDRAALEAADLARLRALDPGAERRCVEELEHDGARQMIADHAEGYAASLPDQIDLHELTEAR